MAPTLEELGLRDTTRDNTQKVSMAPTLEELRLRDTTRDSTQKGSMDPTLGQHTEGVNGPYP